MSIKKLTDKTEYKYSKMRWKDTDYEQLNEAWKSFSKTIRKKDRPVYFKSKEEVLDRIYSRADYNRAVKSLQEVKKEGAKELVHYSKVNQNLTMPKWKYDILKRYDKPNQVRLQAEYNKGKLEQQATAKPEINIYGEDTGTQIVQRLPNEDTTKIESQLLAGTNIDLMGNSEDNFRTNELMERILRRGTNRFDFDRDVTYKENYLNSLEDYKSLDYYDEVMEKLQGIDIKDFFNEVKKVDDDYKVLGEHYKNRMLQADFTLFAEKLGVDINSESLIKKYTTK